MEKNEKQGNMFVSSFFLLFIIVSIFMSYVFDYSLDEWTTIGNLKYWYIPMQKFNCDYETPHEEENKICRAFIDKRIAKAREKIANKYKERDERIANRDRKKTPKELHDLKVRYGLIKETPKKVNTVATNNNFVDLKTHLKTYNNISFKLNNRRYLLNKKILDNERVIKALDEINKTTAIVITETTEGTHKKSKYSHENGYKIDIRSKDLSYEEILNVMKIFNNNGFKVAFEYVDDEESFELGKKIKDETTFPIRKSDNGEHIDVNLASR